VDSRALLEQLPMPPALVIDRFDAE
jgi:hypothetical protein